MQKNLLAAFLFTGIIAITNIAVAEKPPWTGGNKNSNRQDQSDRYQGHENYDQHSDDRRRNQSKEEYSHNS